MKYNVALLYGGASAEHNVSVMGKEYMSRLIEESGHRAISVYVDKGGCWNIDGAPVYPVRNGDLCGMICGGEFIKTDVAIPLLHGEGGESGEVQGALICAGIPYVGARPCDGAVCLDKAYTKAIAQRVGIPTAPWVSFSERTDTEDALVLCEEKIGFPMFIKPRRLGSSIGAYPIADADEFRKYFPLSMSIGTCRVIVEALIEEKRELECALFSISSKTLISHPGEVVQNGFYSFEKKYFSDTATIIHADIEDSVRDTLLEYSYRLAAELSMRHLGRIDYFLTPDGVIFNEVNTFPGFTQGSLYPRLLAEMGIHPCDAIRAFIEDAIADARPV